MLQIIIILQKHIRAENTKKPMAAMLVYFGISDVQFSHYFLIFCNILITANQLEIFKRTMTVTLDTTDKQINCLLRRKININCITTQLHI